MENRETRIFTSDIEVPAVVQKKADAAFAQIRKERAETMKDKKKDRTEHGQSKILKYVRLVAAAAACAVLVTSVGVGNQVKRSHPEPISEEDGGNYDKSVTDEFVHGNMFTMTAYAKELEPGKPVPLTTDIGRSGSSSVLCGDEEEGVNFCISTEFLCEGENIERVGYSINRGAFQIVQSVDPEKGIIVEGKRYDGELNTGMIGGNYDETLDVQPTTWVTLYQSFILDYDRQSDGNTWINICNECPDDGEIRELIWGEGTSLENRNEGINKMLGDTVITCTAYYTDGTTQSADIAVSSRVMTYEEAGEPSGEDEIPKDTESTFITFEVKQ